jgi:hypothetical protein
MKSRSVFFLITMLAICTALHPVSAGIVWNYGIVVVNGTPPGATVTISDGTAGVVPDSGSLTLMNVTADLHQIEIRKEGYNPYSQEIMVNENQTLLVRYSLVLRPTGSLTVNSTPQNATLSLNGNVSGLTPVTLSNLDPGDYLISVQADGYQMWQSNVSIAAGDQKEAQAILIENARPEKTPGPGLVVVISLIVCIGFLFRRKER